LRQEHRSLRTQTNESFSAFRAFTSQMFAQTAALAQQISAITIAYKVLGEGRKGIAGALELGRATKEFEIFTGSAETSLALMSGIRNLAAETPLTMGATTQTVRTLLQYGTANQDVLEITRRLGDVSGGSTERMQRLALAMGQITANGRLQGQELRQLVESGFNPLQVLSKELNVSMMELRIRMSDGSISAEDVASALRSATSEGGRFADALERIGNETAFGKVQKLRGEYEKLRDEMYGPGVEVLAEIASATTNAIRSYRGFVRMFARHETEEGFQRKKKAIASRSLLSVLFGQPSQIAGSAMNLITANMLEVERRAIEMEKAQIEASEKTEIAYDKANESITERIAALRKERNELLMGKESYELMDLRRQGASDEYLDALRKEMQLLDEAKRKQKDAEEAEKKRHEAAMQRQKEKERALEKERADRLKQIEDDRRAAESLAKSIRTPLEVLEDEMTDIQKVAQFLTVNQRVKLMEQARERFNKAMQQDGQLNASAATRGSVEEFRLLSEINKQQVDREQKNHNEAMGARDQTNRLLNLNISGLNILPVKLGAALSELMGTPVRASGVPTFTFLPPPSSFNRR